MIIESLKSNDKYLIVAAAEVLAYDNSFVRLWQGYDSVSGLNPTLELHGTSLF